MCLTSAPSLHVFGFSRNETCTLYTSYIIMGKKRDFKVESEGCKEAVGKEDGVQAGHRPPCPISQGGMHPSYFK